MDKFLYLVRVYLQASFRYFARTGWRDEQTLKQYILVLEEIPLNPWDLKIPDGMRYHCLDIYVDELDKVDEAREGKMPLEVLLQPIRKLGKQSLSKTVRARVKETLEDERLKNWEGGTVEKATDGSREGGSEHTASDVEWDGIED
jgi:ribosomal RNA-processing protein 1